MLRCRTVRAEREQLAFGNAAYNQALDYCPSVSGHHDWISPSAVAMISRLGVPGFDNDEAPMLLDASAS